MDEQLIAAALDYHRLPTPGKISIAPTKGLTNQRDLSLAYSPGVAAACNAIAADPATALDYTSKANLVAVVTNGTAVLGLGNIGALAGKPVMEGKACLFKKFAGIDVFDIELDEHDVDKLVDIVAALEPTFGGINLEDIKAPECFEIERRLKERMKIPVFHDDQHGTAIIAAAAILNALTVVGKDIGAVKLVVSGAGAAAIACLDLLVRLGLKAGNILVCDSKGVIHSGRTGLDASKQRYARDTAARTLADAMPGADIFLGLSGPGVVSQEMVKTMAEKPFVMALANPEPEIRPELVMAVRPDALTATGRSDYPNQVNNVLCFPFIFRGALDVGATAITEEMKLAAVRALAELARAEPSDAVAQALGGESQSFGPNYLIPNTFDQRLIATVAPAVARAAMDSGVATRPITDFRAYADKLTQFVYHSGLIMKPVFQAAKAASQRVIYAEGEDERVLRAVSVVLEEGLAQPILIGRPEVIRMRAERMGLKLDRGAGVTIVNPESDSRFREAWTTYWNAMKRSGVSPEDAKLALRADNTAIGAVLLSWGEADAMLCGVQGGFPRHLATVQGLVGRRAGVDTLAAMNVLMLQKRTLFICDTYVNENPSAEQVVEMTLLAAEEIRRFGIVPRVGLLSHSSFGSLDTPSARKMARARQILAERAPDLEVEGEMHGDAALSATIRNRIFPDCGLTDDANLLVMPTIEAANISFNLLKAAAGDGITVGPILLGAARPVHIMTSSATVRRVVNMTALAVVDSLQGR